MPVQHGAVEPGQLLVRAGCDRVMVLVARVAAEAVGVRQPLVVVGEARRHRVHELEGDAELACADVLDAGGGELLLDAIDGERFGAFLSAVWAQALRPMERNGVAAGLEAPGEIARRCGAAAAAATATVVAAASTDAAAAALRFEPLGIAVGALSVGECLGDSQSDRPFWENVALGVVVWQNPLRAKPPAPPPPAVVGPGGTPASALSAANAGFDANALGGGSSSGGASYRTGCNTGLSPVLGAVGRSGGNINVTIAQRGAYEGAQISHYHYGAEAVGVASGGARGRQQLGVGGQQQQMSLPQHGQQQQMPMQHGHQQQMPLQQQHGHPAPFY